MGNICGTFTVKLSYAVIFLNYFEENKFAVRSKLFRDAVKTNTVDK